MSVKQKVAEIISVRDSLPVEGVIEQLDQMIEEMRGIVEADWDTWGISDTDVENIWTDWTGLELDYFIEFVMENL